MRGGLRLSHSPCLEIIHKVSYSDFPWVRNLPSIIRMLGVEEYSQLDHEGVPGAKIGTAQGIFLGSLN